MQKICYYICFGIGSEIYDFIFDGIKFQTPVRRKY